MAEAAPLINHKTWPLLYFEMLVQTDPDPVKMKLTGEPKSSENKFFIPFYINSNNEYWVPGTFLLLFMAANIY